MRVPYLPVVAMCRNSPRGRLSHVRGMRMSNVPMRVVMFILSTPLLRRHCRRAARARQWAEPRQSSRTTVLRHDSMPPPPSVLSFPVWLKAHSRRLGGPRGGTAAQRTACRRAPHGAGTAARRRGPVGNRASRRKPAISSPSRRTPARATPHATPPVRRSRRTPRGVACGRGAGVERGGGGWGWGAHRAATIARPPSPNGNGTAARQTRDTGLRRRTIVRLTGASRNGRFAQRKSARSVMSLCQKN